MDFKFSKDQEDSSNKAVDGSKGKNQNALLILLLVLVISVLTFVHELGHFLIDEHRNALMLGLSPSHPSFTNFSSDNEVELEADFFASSLLIPKSRLLKDLYRRKFSFEIGRT